ncbi:MAG: hypothetical protein ACTSXK_03775 [Promethearchaeota archaeon]
MFTDPEYPLYKGEELLDILGNLIKKARNVLIIFIVFLSVGSKKTRLHRVKQSWVIYNPPFFISSFLFYAG